MFNTNGMSLTTSPLMKLLVQRKLSSMPSMKPHMPRMGGRRMEMQPKIKPLESGFRRPSLNPKF